jgi:hypothetical protein
MAADLRPLPRIESPPVSTSGALGDRLRIRTALIPAVLALIASALVAFPPPAAAGTSVTVTGTSTGTVPDHFLGVSMEFRTILAYAGENPRALNPVFLQLMRNLTPDGSPLLRIGGESTDRTWWPIAHYPQPAGAYISLTRNWMNVTRAVASNLGAPLILGVNLMANSRKVAGAEARAFVRYIGRRWISALELGNEPELYATIPWYHMSDGTAVLGRSPQTWSYPAFLRQYRTISSALPHLPLAGPATGSPAWSPLLGRFIDNSPRTSLITLHEYPLKHCHRSRQNTVADVLSDNSSEGLAHYAAQFVAIAQSHKLPTRIDEMNSITCGGQRGLSNSFATALWAVDTMDQMAQVGVAGVNLHSTPGVPNELFRFTKSARGWSAAVNPDYYGLLMFARAAPTDSQLLDVLPSPKSLLTTWATRGPGPVEHVVLINKDTHRWRHVTVDVEDDTSGGTLQVLKAPRASSTAGVTLAGQSFGTVTRTGRLGGALYAPNITPHDGAYTVTLRPASAAMLTLTTS